ncbi:M23 family metallopeptidase [Pseudomonas sp. Marseille-QA0892]
MTHFSSASRALLRGANQVVHRQRPRAWLAGAAFIFALGTFAGGYWLGSGRTDPVPEAMMASSDVERPFAVDRLGELAGRLQSLEADTQALQRLLDEHNTLRDRVSEVDPSLMPSLVHRSTSKSGKGGLLMAPRGCAAPSAINPSLRTQLRDSETSAHCLRVALDQMLAEVASRNAALMAIPSRQPVDNGRVGSPFGNRYDPFNRRLAFHSGVDFALPTGSPVYAAAGGRVSATGWFGGYGKRIDVNHGNGLVTRYAHLSAIDVKVGQVVTPGQSIGAVGSTGRSTGPHLHFEVMKEGAYVDPERFLALGHLERDSDAVAQD